MARLAERQHGVASRAQLRDLGLSNRSITHSVAVGRLHPVFRGVFAVGHKPTGHHARLHAATLACGEGAVASHRSAAALLGLLDRSPVVIDVIAPGQSGRGIDGIRLHRVAPPRAKEAGACEAIPCTSPARTLVDLASVLGERSLGRAVERAAMLRVLDIGAIERVLATGRRRGAPTLRSALAGWREASTDRGTGNPPLRLLKLRSDLEARLLALIGAAALPTPLCNQPLVADGKRIEVDFLWPEDRLVVEADGRGFHNSPAAFERDRFRDRALHVAGYRVVRFTHDQIRDEPDAVITAIRRLLALVKEGAAGPVADLVPPPLR